MSKLLHSAPLGRQCHFYAAQPWVCVHHPHRSDLNAYVEASGKWETVAVIQPTSGASAEMLADFIIGQINNINQNKDLCSDALEALESILQDGINFSTEQAADLVLKRAQQKTSRLRL